MGTYFIEDGESYTYLDNENIERSLILDNHRLVRKPGFEVMLCQIDDLSFFQKDKWIYMKVKRKQKNYQFLVGFMREKEINEEEPIS